MGEDLGLFALNGQNPQTIDTMETDVMTGQEFKQMVERMRLRLMQMGCEFFGSDTEITPQEEMEELLGEGDVTVRIFLGE